MWCSGASAQLTFPTIIKYLGASVTLQQVMMCLRAETASAELYLSDISSQVVDKALNVC